MIFRSKKLRGKKVGVLAGDGFEYLELSLPCRALRKAGAKVEIISLHRGKIRGMNLTEPSSTVAVDRTVADVRSEDYDALLIPGGFIGPDLLRQSRDAREFVKDIDAAGKPIATLCHGPWLLVSADLVAGRRLSSWPGVRDDIVNAGGTWRNDAVVRDGNWVTSRGPQDLKEFIPAMLDLYAQGAERARDDESERIDELAASSQNGTSSRSSSPQAEQPPRTVVAAARLLPGLSFRTVLLAATVIGLGVMAVRRGDTLRRKLARV